MVQLFQYSMFIVGFIIVEYLAITIGTFEFKKVLMTELEQINFVTNKNPHPLKRFFKIQGILVFSVGFLTVIIFYYLGNYFRLNSFYMIGVLIAVKIVTYIYYKLKPARLDFADSHKFLQCFRNDYDKFVNVLSIQTGIEMFGLLLGVAIVLLLRQLI